MQLLQSLKHRPFAMLWASQLISQIGDSLYRIALSWWVLEKTGSAAIMGTVLIFSFVPMILFLLLGGVAVDRFPRLKVMLLSDVLRGLLILGIALLALTQRLQIWQIYLASVLFGFVSAFFQPAYTAVVPEITPRPYLPSANSLTSLGQQLANIVGPALGALLIDLGGIPFGFALNGVSFFLSALFLAPLARTALTPTAPTEKVQVLQDLKAGLSALVAAPWLGITIAVSGLLNLTLSGPYNVSLPFLVKDNLGLDVEALGWIYSITSIGSVCAALLLGQLGRLRRRGLLGYVCLILFGAARIFFGLPVPLTGIWAAAFISGAMVSIFALIWMNTLQEMVPGHLLGRVASIDYIGSYVLIPVGYGLAGVLTDHIGAPLVFILGGVATVLISVAGLFHPAVRALD